MLPEPRGPPPDGGRGLGQPVGRAGVLGHAEIRMIHLLQEMPFPVLGVAGHVLVVLDRAGGQAGPLQRAHRLLRRERGGPGPERLGDRGVVTGIWRAGQPRQALPVVGGFRLHGQPLILPAAAQHHARWRVLARFVPVHQVVQQHRAHDRPGHLDLGLVDVGAQPGPVTRRQRRQDGEQPVGHGRVVQVRSVRPAQIWASPVNEKTVAPYAR